MDPVELEIRRKFPQMVWAITHPELGPLLRRAVAEGLDEAGFQGLLLQTEWYKTTQASARTWQRLLNEDPATAAAMFDEKIANVKSLATKLGVTLLDDNELHGEVGYIAALALQGGWDEARLMQEILTKATYKNGTEQGGQLGAGIDRVRQMASDYMVPITEQAAWDLSLKLISGEMDQTVLAAYFKDQAIARFQGNEQVVQMLERGFSPAQIFAPLIQQTAQLLELSPAQIDLTSTEYSGMLDYVDANGNTRPMTLSEAGRFIRGTSAYRSTQGAVDTAASFAEFLGQRMGTVA